MPRRTKRKYRSSRHRRSRHRRSSTRRRRGGRRTRRKRQRRRKRMRGGAVYGTVPYPPPNVGHGDLGMPPYPSSPAAPLPYNERNLAAFPPGGPYRPSSTTNGLDGGYYYHDNTNVVNPPANISANMNASPAGTAGRWRKAIMGQKGGRIKRRKGKKSRKKRRRRRRGKAGGGLLSPPNSVVEAIPGGTDVRDVLWRGGNAAVNLWNTWNGQPNNISSHPSVQPIGEQGLLGFGAQPSMTDLVHDTSLQAAKYT